MNKFSAILLLALLSGCSHAPQSAKHGFVVNDFLTITMEYQNPRELVGVDTQGPTRKAFKCEQAGEAAIMQSDGMIPKSHRLVATCLHISFGGPLPKGSAVSIPVSGTAFEYVTIGVEYTKQGHFFGAQALHSSPDKATCLREAKDVLGSNYRDGHVKAGNSLLLYCMPVPVLEDNAKDEGGVV